MTARLNLNPDPDNLIRVEGPVVVESDADNEVALSVANDPGGLKLNYVGRSELIALSNGQDSIKVSDDQTTMTIESPNQTFTIRRIADTDGTWLSDLQTAVPADALERQVSDPMAGEPETESLFATFDDAEEFQGLIYSCLGGVYTRNAGSWFRYPDDDQSLDGLETIDVDPGFIEAYDKNPAPSRDEVLQYELADTEE
jgi:hypothetical protein